MWELSWDNLVSNQLPDLVSSGIASKEKARGPMRREPSIFNALNSNNRVLEALAHNEEIIRAPMASGQLWGHQHSIVHFEPAGRKQLLRTDIPISTQQPRTTKPAYRGSRLCQYSSIGVRKPLRILEPNRSTMDPTPAEPSHVGECEAVLELRVHHILWRETNAPGSPNHATSRGTVTRGGNRRRGMQVPSNSLALLAQGCWIIRCYNLFGFLQ